MCNWHNAAIHFTSEIISSPLLSRFSTFIFQPSFIQITIFLRNIMSSWEYIVGTWPNIRNADIPNFLGTLAEICAKIFTILYVEINIKYS